MEGTGDVKKGLQTPSPYLLGQGNEDQKTRFGIRNNQLTVLLIEDQVCG
jgi:hypothetical protein